MANMIQILNGYSWSIRKDFIKFDMTHPRINFFKACKKTSFAAIKKLFKQFLMNCCLDFEQNWQDESLYCLPNLHTKNRKIAPKTMIWLHHWNSLIITFLNMAHGVHTYLRTSTHGSVFVVVFEVLLGTCGGGILLLRQTNLSKQCLSDFSIPMLRFFSPCVLCATQNWTVQNFCP